MVFHSDGFVAPGHRAPARSKSFFAIASQLPLELQMVLCNRVYGSPKDLVASKHSETGFWWLMRKVTWT